MDLSGRCANEEAGNGHDKPISMTTNNELGETGGCSKAVGKARNRGLWADPVIGQICVHPSDEERSRRSWPLSGTVLYGVPFSAIYSILRVLSGVFALQGLLNLHNLLAAAAKEICKAFSCRRGTRNWYCHRLDITKFISVCISEPIRAVPSPISREAPPHHC